MGALHDGHFALVAEARSRADRVVVTIFVNPLQFNQSSDFDAYPRSIDDDLVACQRIGVDAVYAPTAATIYPTGFQTHVEPGDLADQLEGAMRPGHFRGVTTIVTKLFGATRPDLAVFGQKDFQQLAVVRRMVADLDLGVEIIGLPTVRESDGLAKSSRNERLDAADRKAAVCISRSLTAAQQSYQAGERDATALTQVASEVIGQEARARLEYLEVVDTDTLRAVENVDSSAVILVAVWFGDVRLIDNCVLSSRTDQR
jgi:pantoate--beta-alanine ligase